MKYKRGMNSKGFSRSWLVFVIILVFAMAVLAQEQVQNKISDLGNETEKFIKKFVEENNEIKEDNIKTIEKIDLENPPEDVKIGNVDENTGVAIYQLNYTENNQEKKLYVVTYSTEQFKTPLELKSVNAIEYLSFGINGERNSSSYLETATGVLTSDKNGYVMIDSGSITGLSTSIEVINSDVNGQIELSIYKNGENTGLTNVIDTSNAGTQKDFDKQSEGIVVFEPGDIISMHLEIEGDVEYKNVISLVKVELEDK
ncbi:MAG: hypothetical protein AABY22_34660 [Nanoarchaeota archaeon]